MALVSTHDATLTVRRTYRFSPETSDAIDALALKLGCSPSDVVRDAVALLTDPSALARHVAITLYESGAVPA